MKFGPISVHDKLGREIVFRNAEISDAEDLIRYMKITTVETPFLIREPDEVKLTVEQEMEFIKSRIDDDRELLLVATIDGKPIGNCSLMSMGQFKRYRHRCEVAIALYQEYCGAGIGRLMLEEVLKIAKKIGYEQAELEVIAENEKAIELYKSLGFEEYGRFPNNMKYANGRYADAYWMMKSLK